MGYLKESELSNFTFINKLQFSNSKKKKEKKKTWVYRYHSLLQQDIFFHSFNKYLLSFPSVSGPVLASGIWWWKKTVFAPKAISGSTISLAPTHIHTPWNSLFNSNLEEGPLALALCYETEYADCPAWSLAICTALAPCLLPTNPEGGRLWILS